MLFSFMFIVTMTQIRILVVKCCRHRRRHRFNKSLPSCLERMKVEPDE